MTSSPSAPPNPGPDGTARPAAGPDQPEEPDLAGEALAREVSALRITAKELRSSLADADSAGIRRDAGRILEPLASVFTDISTITGTAAARSGSKAPGTQDAYDCLEHAHGSLTGACWSLSSTTEAPREEPEPARPRGRFRNLMSLLTRSKETEPAPAEKQDSSGMPSAGAAVSHAEQLMAGAEHLAQYSLPAYLENRQDKNVPEAAALYRPLKTAVGDLKWGVCAVANALRSHGPDLDNWLDPACTALANAESHLDQAWLQTGSPSLSVLAGRDFLPPAAAMPQGYAMTSAGRAVHSAFTSGPAPGTTARGQRPQGRQGPGKAQQAGRSAAGSP